MMRSLFLRLIQRSDLARYALVPIVFALAAALLFALSTLEKKPPHIDAITPTIGDPGDVMIIRGKNFGDERKTSWIEIADNRITGSSIRNWNDEVIIMEIPHTVQDGLVYIRTKEGKSNPHIFANRQNIPVVAQGDKETGIPSIEAFDRDVNEIGGTLVIKGKNFGISQGKAQVLFAWQAEPEIPIANAARSDKFSVACSDHDFDYEFWSDKELRGTIPDGAVSGNVFVETEKGLSNPKPLRLVNQSGTKKYSNAKTYILSVQVDITGVEAVPENSLYIRIPLPESTLTQRDVKITASEPNPYIDNYQGTILHQLEGLKTGRNERISHSLVVTTRDLTTTVNPQQVKPYKDTGTPLYARFTGSDALVPSDNPAITAQAEAIVKKEKNPWRKARLIYDWIIDTIEPKQIADPDRPLTTALAQGSGDAYDMALLFTAFARASGIPATPIAGILVDQQRQTHLHWWAEFWIEGTGWIPVDPALGMNFPFELRSANNRDWYFGNMDSSHIAFSRGWNDQKPMIPNSRVVYRPRTYSFQAVWEESTGQIKGYTTFWSAPKITGVY